MCFTDDTVMSLAIAKALLNTRNDYSDLGYLSIKYMREMARKYPNAGYGMRFIQWMLLIIQNHIIVLGTAQL